MEYFWIKYILNTYTMLLGSHFKFCFIRILYDLFSKVMQLQILHFDNLNRVSNAQKKASENLKNISLLKKIHLQK